MLDASPHRWGDANIHAAGFDKHFAIWSIIVYLYDIIYHVYIYIYTIYVYV